MYDPDSSRCIGINISHYANRIRILNRTHPFSLLHYVSRLRHLATWQLVQLIVSTIGMGPRLPADAKRKKYNEGLLKQPPVNLNRWRRRVVLEAMKETCSIRRWWLWESNIRINHVHTVLTARCQAKIVLNALKANATRKMREAGCWHSDLSPWERRGSKRRLWTQKDLDAAIAYVKYDQGEPLPE